MQSPLFGSLKAVVDMSQHVHGVELQHWATKHAKWMATGIREVSRSEMPSRLEVAARGTLTTQGS